MLLLLLAGREDVNNEDSVPLHGIYMKGFTFLLIMVCGRLSAAFGANEVTASGEVYDLMPIGAVALQPDGRILLADGYGMSLRFVDENTGVFGRVPGGVFRLHANGVVDRTFRSPLSPTNTSTAWQRGLVLQPDGKVLTVLRRQPLVRLLPDGRLDPDFALQPVDGRKPAAWARAGALRPIGLGPNREIVVRASSTEEAPPVGGVMFEIPPPSVQRFDLDGQLLPDRPSELKDEFAGYLTSAGLMTLGGTLLQNTQRGDFMYYQPLEGQLAGPLLGRLVQRVSEHLPLCLWCGALQLSDGKWVVAIADPGSQTCGRLLRFHADWRLDPGFESRFELGKLTYGVQLAEGGHGSLLVVGTFATLNGKPFTGVARLNSDGSTDGSFGVWLEEKDAPVALSVAVQPDGRVLIGGLFTAVNGFPCTYFARLNPDGSVDEPFTRKFSTDAYLRAIHQLRAPHFELASNGSTRARSLAAQVQTESSETIWISVIEMQETAAIVEIKARPNSTYLLQATEVLGSGDWAVVAASTTDAAGVATFKDTAVAELPMCIYRICSGK
jgi:uncharacterized delta-60 repeat protein